MDLVPTKSEASTGPASATNALIHDYLEAAGRGAEDNGALFRPIKNNRTKTLADKLFTAYFTDAFDLSDPEVLKRIGADAGLPAARVAAVIDDGKGAKQVRQLEAEAHRLGIRGVPLLRIGNVVISGARTSAVLAEALRAAAAVEPLAAE